MKLVKFRAYGKPFGEEKNRMINDIGVYGNMLFHPNDIEGKYADGTNFELMQFTGLKDKNGKEIYEGDIVNYQGHQVVGYHLGSFVCYEKKMFGSPYKIDYMRNLSDICEAGDMRKFEVIGNIYENKDLLK